MALPVRKGYKGAPAQAVLTNSPTNSDTSFVVDSVTGWATTFPFYCVVDPGTSKEEKVKVTAISTLTLTVVRAQDDTTASGHSAGAAIYPVFTADEADEANLIASVMTTKGDVIVTDGSTINRLAVGTNTHVLQADSTATNGVKWGSVVNANIDASAAIALSKLATGALPTAITVASANIVDGTIVLADLAASLQAYLCPVGTINAYAGATAPTGWLLCNGTSTTGYAALAALVGATTPDMRGLFPIGKTASSTGSTLLGTGGSTTITTANLPSHSHANTPALSSGTVSITDPGHTHTITDPGHGHSINDHTHSNQVTYISPAASHAHNNISDYVAAGTNGASTSPTVNSISTTSLAANSNTTGISTVSAGTGISASVGTAITANNASTGSGTAYFQPFIAVNYIIKHD